MTKWLKLMLCIRFPPNVTRVTTLNADVLNFYLTQDLLQSDCSDLVSKWRGYTVAATLPDISRLSTDDFLFQQDDAPVHRARDTVAFMEREGNARNASSSKRLRPCTRGVFRAWILTILSRSVITTNNSAEQIIFQSILCANSAVDSLLQIMHFSVM